MRLDGGGGGGGILVDELVTGSDGGGGGGGGGGGRGIEVGAIRVLAGPVGDGGGGGPGVIVEVSELITASYGSVNFDQLSLEGFCLGKSIPGHLAFAERRRWQKLAFRRDWRDPLALDGQAADYDPNWFPQVFISGCRLIKQGYIAASPSAIDHTSPLSPSLSSTAQTTLSHLHLALSLLSSSSFASLPAAPSLAIRLRTHY